MLVKGDGCLTAVGDKPRRYHRHLFSPTKVGAQFFRHQLRTEVRSMVCFRLRCQLWVGLSKEIWEGEALAEP